MSADGLFPDEPPPEAYSRVTDPERFRPLHRLALDLLDRLDAEYHVSRTEAFEPGPGMTAFEHARHPVTLTPVDPAAAPVAIAFTPFPSLIVRFGRWIAEPFPSCGCDACAETAEGEGARLEALVHEVVAGRFREELSIPWLGDARLSWSFGDVGVAGHRSGWTGLPRAQAVALRGRGPRSVQWSPWPRRPSA
ncbi:MAG TPA: DUF6226 family protein [Longimicrobiaceae bacterium]|nr:DUF6226 family protein [Longimicrobiaceae bacterium]